MSWCGKGFEMVYSWMWPGVQVGHAFYAEKIKLTIMSLKPLVYLVEEFATEEEIDNIVSTGKPHLQESF